MSSKQLTLYTSLALNLFLIIWTMANSYLADESNVIEAETLADYFVFYGMPLLALMIVVSICMLLSTLAVSFYRRIT